MTGEVGAQRLLSGRYRVDALLGRGGMSEVYHGYDERLDRPVAIKMLRQATVAITPGSPEELEVLDDQQRDRARFLREIRTAAKLEHPGTPAVYDTGVETRPDGSSRIWLVMQLLRGSTLEGLLDRADYEAAAPAVSWAAATAAQVAAVLADVHRVEIVHRDIKPANIMIVDGGLVKVLDFGIAILRGAGALPRLTQIDRTVGTPMYMSPEQHLGRAVTAASDVYSLGCLLYELLTGDPPYLERAGGSVRALHLQSPIPSVRDARSQVPAALAALVGSMLAKDPDERPTAEDVYRALVPFTVEPATPDGDEDRDPTRPFRTPLLAPPPRREPARRGDGLTEQEFEQLQAEAGQLLARDDTAEAVRRLENGLERSAGNRFHALELRRLLGVALFYVGELRRAATCLTEAGAQYRAEGLPPAHPRVLECSYYAGQALAELGETGRALAQLRFYVLHADQRDPECAEPLIESRFMIAQLLAADDRTEEARSELEALRPDLVRVYGAGSVFDRSLERQLDKLRGL